MATTDYKVCKHFHMLELKRFGRGHRTGSLKAAITAV